MPLRERLETLPAKSRISESHKQRNRPSGWEPSVVWNGDSGTITTDALTEMPNEWEEILSERGLDPEKYEVVGDSIKWCSYDGWKRDAQGEDAYSAICYSFRAEIRRRSGPKVDLEALYKEIRKIKPSKKEPAGGTKTLLINLSDFQVGNEDFGGVDEQLRALADLPEKVVQRVSDLRRMKHDIGTIAFAGLGDLVENNCFAHETEVITKYGVFPIGELAMKGSAILKSEYGSWIESEIKSFGVQPLLKLTLSRGGTSRKEVYVTAGHRWFRLKNPSGNSGKMEVTTEQLLPGDLLVSNFGKHTYNMSPVGVMAGYVYGDGHRQDAVNRQEGCSVNVHRGDFSLLSYFAGHLMSDVRHHAPSTFNQTEMSDYVKVSGMPSFFKDAPSLDESLQYLFGWAAGYFAADGSVGKTVSLASVDKFSLEHFISVCSRIGIGTNPIKSQDQVSIIDGKKRTLYSVTLLPSTIPTNFFVHQDKLQKFMEMQEGKTEEGRYTFQKNRARHWRVESVETTDRVEEVFCAVVPGTHSFTLANDLLTGNCGFYPSQLHRTGLDGREQAKVVRRALKDLLVASLPHAEELKVICVPGNHGEKRDGGKANTRVGDNTDVEVFEQVAEVMTMHPEAHRIKWRIPSDEIAVAVELSGQHCAFTHGHVARGSGNAAEVMWNWWRNQTMGRAYEGVADADLLFAGHYHHFCAKEQANRAVFVCPSLTNVGEYFANSAGVTTKAGTLALLLDHDGWGELSVI